MLDLKWANETSWRETVESYPEIMRYWCFGLAALGWDSMINYLYPGSYILLLWCPKLDKKSIFMQHICWVCDTATNPQHWSMLKINTLIKMSSRASFVFSSVPALGWIWNVLPCWRTRCSYPLGRGTTRAVPRWPCASMSREESWWFPRASAPRGSNTTSR